MLLAISAFFFSVHVILLIILCSLGLHRLSMAIRWKRHGSTSPRIDGKFAELPALTIQIPIYNERFVAERAIDAAVAICYPREKLHIQIVDDSSDDTSQLISDRVAFHRGNGIPIDHVRRNNREGYKAGALKSAMEHTRGEFIAIFDADFVPAPGCLIENIHHFSNPRVGMIQFRWEHLNRASSSLTEAQAIMLDAHFGLEQQVRSASGKFFNFNGTAGIWRRQAIIDAGNWSADTLTEDLDLSYRAQLKGWEMGYLNEVSCPAELPANMAAFKSQQHRWTKGGVQVMKKLLLEVWRAPITLAQKIEASFHLSNNLAYFVLLVDTLFFLLPSLWVRSHYQMVGMWWLDLSLILVSSGGHLVYLYYGQVALGHSRSRALMYLPRLLMLAIQLTTTNARAGFEALRGSASEFVRTPKVGDIALQRVIPQHMRAAIYKAIKPKGVMVELLLVVIYVFVILWAIRHEQWLIVPFLIFICAGFAVSSVQSMIPEFRERAPS
ncbi:MAG: glycosyltransferase family 2 protein [Lysobacterales bacterium]